MGGLPEVDRADEEGLAGVGQDQPPGAAVIAVRLDRHQPPAFEWLQRGGQGRAVHGEKRGDCAHRRRRRPVQRHEKRELPAGQGERAERVVETPRERARRPLAVQAKAVVADVQGGGVRDGRRPAVLTCMLYVDINVKVKPTERQQEVRHVHPGRTRPRRYSCPPRRWRRRTSAQLSQRKRRTYRQARNALLVEEIELRRHIERVAEHAPAAAARRRGAKGVRFVGEDGPVTLAGLFGGQGRRSSSTATCSGRSGAKPCPMCTSLHGVARRQGAGYRAARGAGHGGALADRAAGGGEEGARLDAAQGLFRRRGRRSPATMSAPTIPTCPAIRCSPAATAPSVISGAAR